MKKRRRLLRYYPIAVSLQKKRVLVVGGGAVAERKVQTLREADARVKLISPTATPLLKRLAGERAIEWKRRRARSRDVRNADIIVAATDKTDTNEAVRRWALKYRTLVNVVDQPSLSDFISPAVLNTEDAIITVYTDGKDPVLSRDLKNFLKERWDEFIYYRNRL